MFSPLLIVIPYSRYIFLYNTLLCFYYDSSMCHIIWHTGCTLTFIAPFYLEFSRIFTSSWQDQGCVGGGQFSPIPLLLHLVISELILFSLKYSSLLTLQYVYYYQLTPLVCNFWHSPLFWISGSGIFLLIFIITNRNCSSITISGLPLILIMRGKGAISRDTFTHYFHSIYIGWVICYIS